MHTADSWPAWKRALRWGMRDFRKDGLLRPAFFLSTGLLLLSGGVMAGVLSVLQLETQLATQSTVTVELQASAGDQKVQDLYEAAKAQSFLTGVEYITKEQALTQQRTAHPELAAFLDRFQLQNPFPNLLVVHLRSPAMIVQLRAFLQDARFTGAVAPAAATALATREEELRSLSSTLSAVHGVALSSAVIVVLLLLSLVVDLAWSRLRHRDDERRAVMLMGGGWVERDGAAVVQLTLLLWCAAGVAALLLLGALFLLCSVTGGGVQTFFVGLQSSTLALLPPLLLLTAVCLPCAALFAAACTRPLRRASHG